jgi:nucleotide-binding universal stress UspA family protein
MQRQHERPSPHSGNNYATLGWSSNTTSAETRLRRLRILIAVDGSGSEEVLRLAATLAHPFNWSVVVCHVTAPTTSTFDGPASIKRARLDALQAGERVLAAARETLADIEAEYELLEGDAAEVICRRAEELECDIVVVGTRGSGLFARWLTGSVSSAIVSKAPCSVLVVRRRRRRSARRTACPQFSEPRVTMVNVSSIRRGMDVYANGEHVGRVKEVNSEAFLLDRPWRRDVWVPIGTVTAVVDGAVLVHSISSVERLRSVASVDSAGSP